MEMGQSNAASFGVVGLALTQLGLRLGLWLCSLLVVNAVDCLTLLCVYNLISSSRALIFVHHIERNTHEWLENDYKREK